MKTTLKMDVVLHAFNSTQMKTNLKSDMVVHTFNSNSQNVEPGGSSLKSTWATWKDPSQKEKQKAE